MDCNLTVWTLSFVYVSKSLCSNQFSSSLIFPMVLMYILTDAFIISLKFGILAFIVLHLLFLLPCLIFFYLFSLPFPLLSVLFGFVQLLSLQYCRCTCIVPLSTISFVLEHFFQQSKLPKGAYRLQAWLQQVPHFHPYFHNTCVCLLLFFFSFLNRKIFRIHTNILKFLFPA